MVDCVVLIETKGESPLVECSVFAKGSLRLVASTWGASRWAVSPVPIRRGLRLLAPGEMNVSQKGKKSRCSHEHGFGEKAVHRAW